MKKILFSLLMMVFAITTNAADAVSITGPVQVKSGKTATFDVNFEFDAANKYTAVGLAFTLPAGFTLVSATGNDSWSGATFALNEWNGVGYKLDCYHTSNAVLQGNSGVLVTLTIAEDGSNALGTYNATMNDMTNAKVNGFVVYGTATETNYFDVSVPFQIQVVEDVLDLYDTDTTLPAASTESKVIIHRNFTANVWSTFVVPFDMDATQVEAAFGAGAQVAKFTDQVVDDNEIVLTFTSQTTIAANEPVIVKPTTDLTQITVEGTIVIDAEDGNSVVVGKGKSRSYMYGVYVPTLIKPSQDDWEFPLFLSGNKFYYAGNAGTTIKGYRAYINTYDPLAAIGDDLGVKMLIDADPTAIGSIDADYESGMTYTVDGKFVGKDVDLKRMQKGVYIVNGKKVINK